MRIRKLIAPALFALTFVPVAAESAFAAPDPTGIWMNDTGRGAVEIKQCGNALCGNVVWVKSATDSKGCGKQIIGGVAPVGGGRWDNGWIYSPEKGRKYDVELTPLKNGTLRVTGYAGVKFLSKTMIWTRAPQDLQLCGQTVAKTETPAAKSDGASASVSSAAPDSGDAFARSIDGRKTCRSCYCCRDAAAPAGRNRRQSRCTEARARRLSGTRWQFENTE